HILQLKNIRIPVLIINGEYDVEDFHDISEVMIKEIPYVKKITMPNIAHLANLESPKEFLNLIPDFFLDNAN
ncbi:alpha/beta hydrolase, partial [Staphylococcus saprophyticus]|nr:alpha/beta hydrolase [Staphylococcus saprophyticus]